MNKLPDGEHMPLCPICKSPSSILLTYDAEQMLEMVIKYELQTANRMPDLIWLIVCQGGCGWSYICAVKMPEAQEMALGGLHKGWQN